MLVETITRLHYLCDTIPPLLKAVSEDEYNRKPSPEKWCKKEILGHLIDSASNNHQRFIRVQYEDIPSLVYHTDHWVSLTDYKNSKPLQLISLWEAYNRHLLFIIEAIPPENLVRKCITNEKSPVTLQWLIQDYVKHLEYHLKQIVTYQ